MPRDSQVLAGTNPWAAFWHAEQPAFSRFRTLAKSRDQDGATRRSRSRDAPQSYPTCSTKSIRRPRLLQLIRVLFSSTLRRRRGSRGRKIKIRFRWNQTGKHHIQSPTYVMAPTSYHDCHEILCYINWRHITSYLRHYKNLISFDQILNVSFRTRSTPENTAKSARNPSQQSAAIQDTCEWSISNSSLFPAVFAAMRSTSDPILRNMSCVSTLTKRTSSSAPRKEAGWWRTWALQL